MTGLNPRSGLARDIACVIAVKLALLYGIYLLYFDKPVSEQARVEMLSGRVYQTGDGHPVSGRTPP